MGSRDRVSHPGARTRSPSARRAATAPPLWRVARPTIASTDGPRTATADDGAGDVGGQHQSPSEKEPDIGVDRLVDHSKLAPQVACHMLSLRLAVMLSPGTDFS